MIHRTFDRTSKTLSAQLHAFKRELDELEQRVAPAVLVTRARKDGRFLHITVLAAVRANSTPYSPDVVEAWSPL